MIYMISIYACDYIHSRTHTHTRMHMIISECNLICIHMNLNNVYAYDIISMYI
jgi:hypothetical protein